MRDRWQFVRRTARNTGSTPSAGPVDGPQSVWRHDAGARIFGTPLVDGERVYVATSAQTHHDNGCAVAIDRRTGERAWMAAFDAMEVRGTPAIVDGAIYLVDLDSRMFVLERETGDRIHKLDEQGMSPPDGVCPLSYDGTVFVTPYVLEARFSDDLTRRWVVDDAIVEDPVAIANDTVFVGGYRSSGERVYLGTDENRIPEYVIRSQPFVRAVDAGSGSVRWETAIDGRPRAPAVVGDTVFVPTSGSEPQGKRVSTVKPGAEEQPIPDEDPTPYRAFGTVHALDANTGGERWSTRLSDPVRTMPAVDGTNVCVGTGEGMLVALDATTGERRWRYQVNDDCGVLSSPTIADGVVYVGSDDDALVALELATGDELWRFPTDAAVDANPSIVDGTLYVADNGGTVYALE